MRIIFAWVAFLCLGSNFSFAQRDNDILDGYTDKSSYRAGETVTFFLNSPSDVAGIAKNIDIHDVNGTVVETISKVRLIHQSFPSGDYWANGFGYTASTTTWTINTNLKSGVYYIYTKDAEFPIPVIIKLPTGTEGINHSQIVVLIPTNTDEAYNTDAGDNTIYGAHSLYDNDPNTGLTYPIVSFLRPMQSYQHDYYDGFLKWYQSTNYDNSALYNTNFIADRDLNDDYNEIANATLLIVIGHSEYWSRQERMNFDRFIDAGGNALVVSGNTMWWQVRCHSAQMGCWKTGIDAEHDLLLKTINWWCPSLK